MWYMGGKFRQRRAIADALRPYIDDNTTYVEPFLGGGWSFAYVIETRHPGHVIGADVNGSLIELWRKVVAEGVDWLPTSLEEVEANYHTYKDAQDMSDPLTAWYGCACSFGGKWYGGVARNQTTTGPTGFEAQARSTEKKAASMRTCPDLRLLCCSYDELEIPDGAVVYCDPPYSGGKSRTKAHRFDDFDVDAYYGWVRELSRRCVVICSTCDPPEDFEVLHVRRARGLRSALRLGRHPRHAPQWTRPRGASDERAARALEGRDQVMALHYCNIRNIQRNLQCNGHCGRDVLCCIALYLPRYMQYNATPRVVQQEDATTAPWRSRARRSVNKSIDKRAGRVVRWSRHDGRRS